jgi:hypothetical protein
MSQIKVDDIKVSGLDLFSDSENFLTHLDSNEVDNIVGGLAAVNAACCCSCCCSCKAAE